MHNLSTKLIGRDDKSVGFFLTPQLTFILIPMFGLSMRERTRGPYDAKVVVQKQ